MTVLQQYLIDVVQGGMRRKKLKQKELAVKAQVSEAYLSQLLNGRSEGTLSVWQKLIDVLKKV